MASTLFLNTEICYVSAFTVGTLESTFRIQRNVLHAQSDPALIEMPEETESDESSKSFVKLEGRELRKTPTSSLLEGVTAVSVRDGEAVELCNFLTSSDDKAMLIFGTYAADFNAIEYAQRLRYYLPKLQAGGIQKIGLVLNCEADAAKTLVEMVDLATDATNGSVGDLPIVELLIDPEGNVGRNFGVGRGWKEDDEATSPYLKLFGMLFGLGAWATLPAVIGGYIGNPFLGQPWIEDALALGQRKERWPDTALELDERTGDIASNKFKELPLVGKWERRPLELATLRLQNMIDISIKNWGALAPTEKALKAGVLTQLGGCVVMDSKTGEDLYTWRDPGICAVANFEDILLKIPNE